MELYEEMIISALQTGDLTLQIAQCEIASLMESKCYVAIKKIRDILADETLDDPECFLRIHDIICTLEEIGISCGTRHDFG